MVSVTLDQVVQKDFLGVNATYHGFAWMPEQVSKGMNDEDRAREFSRVQRLGLRIARTWYRPDWACGANLHNNFNWESARMQALCKWLQAMKERNVAVALQAGWWFPGDTYYGNPLPRPEQDVERYAQWVSESVRQLITVKGFTNVRYLILFTEPTTTSAGVPPANTAIWDYYKTVVTAIHRRLSADGRRGLVKLVGPNNTNGGVHLAEAVRELNDVLDIYSGHIYNNADYEQWFGLCSAMQKTTAPTGKELWLDEYGKQDERYHATGDYGNYIAQAVAASMNAGNQTSLAWLLFDQQYVDPLNQLTNSDSFYRGVHRWGTCKWPRDRIENPTYPYPYWYAFSLMSRYLGGGPDTKVVRTSSAKGVYVTAVQHPSGHWSFMVVNGHRTARNVVMKLSQPLQRTLYRYLYDPGAVVPDEAAALLGYNRTFPDVDVGFSDTLPARAVAVYSTQHGNPATTPTPPTELSASVPAGVKVHLTWQDRSENEAGFKIERRDATGDFSFLALVGPNTNDYDDLTASVGVAYGYQVSAVTSDGGSSPAGEACVVVPGVRTATQEVRAVLARWPLEGNGGDASGNGHNLELKGTRFTKDAPQGASALRFDGAGSGQTALVELGDKFTLSLWFRIDPDAKGIQMLLANCGGPWATDGFMVYVNTWQTMDRKVILQTGNGRDGLMVATQAGAVEFGKWHHVALAVNRLEEKADIYLDGCKIAAMGGVRADFKKRGPVRIGSSTNDQFPLKGELDDVRIDGYVLSDEEIAKLPKD